MAWTTNDLFFLIHSLKTDRAVGFQKLDLNCVHLSYFLLLHPAPCFLSVVRHSLPDKEVKK